MRIKSLRLKAFGQYRDECVVHFGKGLCVIGGPNGVGKTTLLTAVMWALTGKGVPAESIRTWGLRREATEVEVTYEDMRGSTWRVTRYRHHTQHKNGVTLHRDGVRQVSETEDHSVSLAKFTQPLIDASVGMSMDLLRLSAYMAQDEPGLCEMDSSAVKRVLEQFARVDAYAEAHSRAKTEQTRLRSIITELDGSTQYTENRLESLQQRQTQYMTQSASPEEITLKITKLQKEYEDTYERVAALNREHSHVTKDLESIERKISQCVSGQKQMVADRRKHQAELDFLAKSISRKRELLNRGECSACDRPIDKVDSVPMRRDIESMQIKHDNLNSVCSEISGKIGEMETTERSLRQAYTSLNSKQNKLYRDKVEEESSLERIDDRIKHMEKQREQEVKFLAVVRSDIEQCHAKLEELHTRYSDVSDRLSAVDFWVNGFGTKGLRRHLVGALIKPLNQRLSYWTQRLSNTRLDAAIGASTTQKGVNLDKLQVYGVKRDRRVAVQSFSGGERTLVNVAFRFALCEMLGVKSLLFDEWFRACDADAVSEVATALQELAKERTVIVISHKESLQPTHLVEHTKNTSRVIHIN